MDRKTFDRVATEAAKSWRRLRGGVRPSRGPRGERWPPAARLISGAAGIGLIVLGARRRGWLGRLMAVIGLGVLSRAATNRSPRRLLRAGRAPDHLEVRRITAIQAPVGEVYGFWQRWENLSRFLGHVREVRDQGSGWTRWAIAGPGGTEMVFDAVVTAAIPDHLLAWKTAPRQPIHHAGIVRFEEVSPGVTRLDVKMTYDRPAGQSGYEVAGLFAKDPVSALGDDLRRLEALLAERTTPATSGSGIVAEAAPRAEEAIVAAQDAGVEPLILTEPEQAEPPAAEEAAKKPRRRRTRTRRTEGPDQPDL